MKFGQVSNPENIDFTLPPDHPNHAEVFKHSNRRLQVSIGCAKWNKTDLKNFYPRGTKDELSYYSSQFNSIELNATFYNPPVPEQVKIWKSKTPTDFRFFPKLNQSISHLKRLNNVNRETTLFCDAVSHFEEKLGMVFLQLHDNFKPKDFGRLENFIQDFPKAIPLAVEVRNAEWFSDEKVSDLYCQLCEANNVTNVLVDTAGRRDMMHMRFTTPKSFVRWVGANHPTDYPRLDSWLNRMKQWKEKGLQELNFFIHQNVELESPLLSAYLIKKMNSEMGTALTVPQTLI